MQVFFHISPNLSVVLYYSTPKSTLSSSQFPQEITVSFRRGWPGARNVAERPGDVRPATTGAETFEPFEPDFYFRDLWLF